jgi:hypothetical protein
MKFLMLRTGNLSHTHIFFFFHVLGKQILFRSNFSVKIKFKYFCGLACKVAFPELVHQISTRGGTVLLSCEEAT